MAKHRMTKACSIPLKVKRAVWKRDQRCILCGSVYGVPNAHYIARAQGGLGIEQNVVTLCPSCHAAYDNSEERNDVKEQIKIYLQSQYPDWEEGKLVYCKHVYATNKKGKQPQGR